MIGFACPNCGSPLSAPDESAGGLSRCPCGRTVAVPKVPTDLPGSDGPGSRREGPARQGFRFGWLRMTEVVVLGVVLAILGGVLLLRPWERRTYQLNMLVDLDPNRALLAERIAKEGVRHGLHVELSSKPYGSLDEMELVDLPNPIDLALVPGGVARRDYANVRLVTALAPEPLQLLTRGELAPQGVEGLKGRRVCLGPPTACVHFLARDVLAFAGLRAAAAGHPGDYALDKSSPQELRLRLERLRTLTGTAHDQAVRELPDAVFLLSPLPSVLARDLVTRAGYRLVALPFADAYCLDRFGQTQTAGVRINRASFSVLEIPAHTYSVAPPVPEKPCRTLATPLLLIAYAATEPEGVAQLLETVFDGPVAALAGPKPLREQVPQFPFHSGAERYMRRAEPVLSPELVSTLAKALGGLGAFISGVVAVYGYLRLRQLRRFASYYQEIRRLELVARGQEADPSAPAAPAALRAYLEDRLLDLKSRALQDFASGGLTGEGLMSGIVSLVNDTRASLARLGPAAQPAPRPEAPPAEASAGHAEEPGWQR
jgi:TRAP-type uncharacterized transport system substrate-binding protein